MGSTRDNSNAEDMVGDIQQGHKLHSCTTHIRTGDVHLSAIITQPGPHKVSMPKYLQEGDIVGGGGQRVLHSYG